MDKKYVVPLLLMLCCRSALAETTAAGLNIVPDGTKSFLTVHAKGDQIYRCVADSTDYAWKWQAPDAKLFADKSAQSEVGTHGAGPNWKYKDGSGVTAKMLQKIDSPDENSVPWLLLEATEHSGKGLLAQTQYILRLNTKGGVQPTSGCDASHIGAEAKSAYSADYTFYSQ